MTVDIFNTLRDLLGLQDQMKVDALLKGGMSMEQVIGYFLEGGIDEPSMLEEHFEIDVEADEEHEDDGALEDVETMISTPIPTSTTKKTTTTTKATTTTKRTTTTRSTK